MSAETETDPVVIPFDTEVAERHLLAQPIPEFSDVLERGGHVSCSDRAAGIHVVHAMVNGQEVGYGQHPHIEQALALAAEDVAAGVRPFKEVYGERYLHFVTGSTEPASKLDAWMMKGHRVRFERDGRGVVAHLYSFEESGRPSEEQVAEVLRTERPTTSRTRGFTIEHRYEVSRGGQPTVSSRPISGPDNKDPWFFHSIRTGVGSTVREALEDAFGMPAGEVTSEQSDAHCYRD